MHDTGVPLCKLTRNHEVHEGKGTKHTKRKAEDNDIKRMVFERS